MRLKERRSLCHSLGGLFSSGSFGFSDFSSPLSRPENIVHQTIASKINNANNASNKIKPMHHLLGSRILGSFCLVVLYFCRPAPRLRKRQSHKLSSHPQRRPLLKRQRCLKMRPLFTSGPKVAGCWPAGLTFLALTPIISTRRGSLGDKTVREPYPTHKAFVPTSSVWMDSRPLCKKTG